MTSQPGGISGDASGSSYGSGTGSASGTAAAPPWRLPAPEQLPGVPSWGVPTTRRPVRDFPVALLSEVSPEWAWGGSDGSGVRLCLLDSGVDAAHPWVGALDRSLTVEDEPDGGGVRVVDCPPEDTAGHGTACAGIIRSAAPGVSLTSVRVLGDGRGGSIRHLLAGLHWAVQEGFDVINLSVSTTRSEYRGDLYELADQAFFRRCMLVVAAHNMPVRSFPWTYASVISVASHDEADPARYYYNPSPPVEFYARGVRVPVARPGGRTSRGTGNSFAAPQMAALAARVLGKHPWLTPFQLKSVLMLASANVTGRPAPPQAAGPGSVVGHG